jgi:pimeloyl-ACP methyl ester carboxylesterase
MLSATPLQLAAPEFASAVATELRSVFENAPRHHGALQEVLSTTASPLSAEALKAIFGDPTLLEPLLDEVHEREEVLEEIALVRLRAEETVERQGAVIAPAGTSTEQDRSAEWEARQSARLEALARLTERRSAVGAELAAVDREMAMMHEEFDDVSEDLQTLEQLLSVPPKTITPTINADTAKGSKTVSIVYRNMPAGVQIAIVGTKSSRSGVPAGNGAMTLTIPSTTLKGTMTVQLERTSGQMLATLLQFDAQLGKTSAVRSDPGEVPIGQLSSVDPQQQSLYTERLCERDILHGRMVILDRAMQDLELRHTTLAKETPADLRADIARASAREAAIGQEIADLTARADKIERHLRGEVQTITPTIDAWVKTGDIRISVSHNHLLDGILLEIDGQRTAVPAGTALDQFEIPSTGPQRTFSARILRGDTAATIGEFSFRALRGKARSGGGSGTIALPFQAQIDPRELEGGPFTAEELRAVRSAISDREHERNGLAAKRAGDSQKIAVHDAEVSALRRSLVPYTSMTVEPMPDPLYRNVDFRVRFRSKLPETQIRILGAGERILGDARIAHPQGEEEREWIWRSPDPEYQGTVVFEMWSTGESPRLLENAVLRQRDRVPEEITEQQPFHEHETGRLAEHPVPWSLRVARIAGPNVLVQVTSPSDKSIVTLENGQSIVGEHRLSHTGGTAFSTAIVTINTARPTGEYNIVLTDRGTGTIRDRIPLHWDSATRTLRTEPRFTLEGNSSRLADPEDVNVQGDVGIALAKTLGNELGEMLHEDATAVQFEKMQMLSGMDYAGTDLLRIEGVRLYEGSRFFIHGNRIGAMVAAHPVYGRYDQNSSVASDMRTDLGRLLGAYQSAMGDILQRGVSVYVTVRQGGSQQDAVNAVQFAIDYHNRLRYIRELAADFGVTIPSKDDVLAECLKLYDQNIDRLINNQDEAMHLRKWANALPAHPPDPKDPVMQARANGQYLAALTQSRINAARYGQVDADATSRLARIQNRVEWVIANSHDQRIVALREQGVTAAVAADTVVSRLGIASLEEQSSSAEEPATQVLGASSIIGTLDFGEPRTLDIREGLRIGAETVTITPDGVERWTFTLDREVMASFWVDGMQDRNLALTISGGSLPKTGYPSDHGMERGVSTSLRLTPGTYTIMLQDRTPYGTMHEGHLLQSGKTNVTLQMDVQPWRTQEITGRISIPESGKTMPVSMRVAEFDPDTGDRLSVAKNGLDPSKPVWVVIHGRTDSESSNKMKDLAKALTETGRQTATINWEDAAKDNGIGLLEGANWVPSMGSWIANQLQAAGFSGEHIRVAGHSWGSFVAFEIGKSFKGTESTPGNGFGVQSIVALDSAKDPLPVNTYPASAVSFADVSKASWAFRSSFFGSEGRTNSADVSFDLITPSELRERDNPLLSLTQKALLDAAQAYLREHGYAVSFFANLLRGQGDASLQTLNIAALERGALPSIPLHADGAEGEIYLGLVEVKDESGTWWQAKPKSLHLQ